MLAPGMRVVVEHNGNIQAVQDPQMLQQPHTPPRSYHNRPTAVLEPQSLGLSNGMHAFSQQPDRARDGAWQPGMLHNRTANDPRQVEYPHAATWPDQQAMAGTADMPGAYMNTGPPAHAGPQQQQPHWAGIQDPARASPDAEAQHSNTRAMPYSYPDAPPPSQRHVQHQQLHQQHAAVPASGSSAWRAAPHQRQQQHSQCQLQQHNFDASSAADNAFLPQAPVFSSYPRQDYPPQQAGLDNAPPLYPAANPAARSIHGQQPLLTVQPDMRRCQTDARPEYPNYALADSRAGAASVSRKQTRLAGGSDPFSGATWPGQEQAQGRIGSQTWSKDRAAPDSHLAISAAQMPPMRGHSSVHSINKYVTPEAGRPSLQLDDQPPLLGHTEPASALQAPDLKQNPTGQPGGMLVSANQHSQAAAAELNGAAPCQSQDLHSSELRPADREGAHVGVSQLAPELQAQLMRLLQLNTAAPSSAAPQTSAALPDSAVAQMPQQLLLQPTLAHQQMVADLPAAAMSYMPIGPQTPACLPLDMGHPTNSVSGHPAYHEDMDSSLTTPR